jgi:hypothetical protein
MSDAEEPLSEQAHALAALLAGIEHLGARTYLARGCCTTWRVSTARPA